MLTVCHLYPRKSVDVPLRAMPRVRAAVPDAQLHIVGVGPEAARLVALRDALGLWRPSFSWAISRSSS